MPFADHVPVGADEPVERGRREGRKGLVNADIPPSRLMQPGTNRHHLFLPPFPPSSLRCYLLAIGAPGGIEEDGHIRRPLLQVVQQLFRRQGNDGLLLLLGFSLCGGGGSSAVAGHGEEEEAEEAEEEDEEEGEAGDG